MTNATPVVKIPVIEQEMLPRLVACSSNWASTFGHSDSSLLVHLITESDDKEILYAIYFEIHELPKLLNTAWMIFHCLQLLQLSVAKIK